MLCGGCGALLQNSEIAGMASPSTAAGSGKKGPSNSGDRSEPSRPGGSAAFAAWRAAPLQKLNSAQIRDHLDLDSPAASQSQSPESGQQIPAPVVSASTAASQSQSSIRAESNTQMSVDEEEPRPGPSVENTPSKPSVGQPREEIEQGLGELQYLQKKNKNIASFFALSKVKDKNLVFLCQKCLPTRKEVSAHVSSVTNLKAHIKSVHPRDLVAYENTLKTKMKPDCPTFASSSPSSASTPQVSSTCLAEIKTLIPVLPRNEMPCSVPLRKLKPATKCL